MVVSDKDNNSLELPCVSEEIHPLINSDTEIEKSNKNEHCSLNWSFIMILRMLSVVFVTFMLYKIIPEIKFFSFHPILMLIAYPVCMLEAILLFSSWPIINSNKKQLKVTWHWILQILCLILSSVGFGVAFYNKTLLGKSHFTTWHSWFGLATLIASILNSLGGLAAKYPSLIQGRLKPLVVKTVHAGSACITYTFICISFVTGLQSGYFTRLVQQSLPVWQLAYAVPILTALAVIIQVFQSYIPRYRF